MEMFSPRNIIDIAIVAYFFYKISMMIRETRAIDYAK